MKFTDKQHNKMLLASSAAYLTNELPVDFLNLTEDEQATFLSENVWASLEDEDTSDVFQLIVDNALRIQRLVVDVTDGSKVDSDDRFFLVKLNIRNGEYVEPSLNLYNCDSKEDAVKLAMDGNTRDKLEYPDGEDGAAYDCHGEIALSLHSVVEVPQLDASILRKYL